MIFVLVLLFFPCKFQQVFKAEKWRIQWLQIGGGTEIDLLSTLRAGAVERGRGEVILMYMRIVHVPLHALRPSPRRIIFHSRVPQYIVKTNILLMRQVFHMHYLVELECRKSILSQGSFNLWFSILFLKRNLQQETIFHSRVPHYIVKNSIFLKRRAFHTLFAVFGRA